jgi:hypothetical protein
VPRMRETTSGKLPFSANRYSKKVRRKTTALPYNFSGHAVAITCIFALSLIAAIHPAWIAHLPLRCQMQVIFGVKCPFCGMTRDFIDMWHHTKPSRNPASFVTAVFIYLVYPILFAWAWVGRTTDVFQSTVFRKAILVAILFIWTANNLSR